MAKAQQSGELQRQRMAHQREARVSPSIENATLEMQRNCNAPRGTARAWQRAARERRHVATQRQRVGARRMAQQRLCATKRRAAKAWQNKTPKSKARQRDGGA